MSKWAQEKAMGENYIGCVVLLFDQGDNVIGSTKVTHVDNEALRIEVQQLPKGLDVGSACRLLIFNNNRPSEYQGKIVREGAKILIAIGRTGEKRKERRGEINARAQIEGLIYGGQMYPLHRPIEVTLINISRGGVRIKAPNDTLVLGNKFQAGLNINDVEKVIVAETVNLVDKDSGISEYGCRFLAGDIVRSGER
ncbi:MAG: PilZ domain-containing protein [Oscillospiraceae bacterium]|nr:PilZ domain-containing protein [Oscillospiraceae bacterium]